RLAGHAPRLRSLLPGARASSAPGRDASGGAAGAGTDSGTGGGRRPLPLPGGAHGGAQRLPARALRGLLPPAARRPRRRALPADERHLERMGGNGGSAGGPRFERQPFHLRLSRQKSSRPASPSRRSFTINFQVPSSGLPFSTRRSSSGFASSE